MIGADYRKANAGKADDWTKSHIRKYAYTVDKLPEGSKAKPKTSANRTMMIALATANGLGEKAEKFKDDSVSNNGQMVMSITNMLRAVAKKRFGLYDLDEHWRKIEPTDGLIEDIDGPVEKKDGTPVKAKTKAADAE